MTISPDYMKFVLMHVELICVVKQFSRGDSYVLLLLCGDIGVGESFVGGSYSCWRFSSRVYGTSCRVFSSCSLNDSLPEGLNQPIQSSLHTHTFLTQLFMSLKLHLLNIYNYPLTAPTESVLPTSLWLPGHGEVWKFDSKDEGRRRYRHHRRRKRRGG